MDFALVNDAAQDVKSLSHSAKKMLKVGLPLVAAEGQPAHEMGCELLDAVSRMFCEATKDATSEGKKAKDDVIEAEKEMETAQKAISEAIAALSTATNELTAKEAKLAEAEAEGKAKADRHTSFETQVTTQTNFFDSTRQSLTETQDLQTQMMTLVNGTFEGAQPEAAIESIKMCILASDKVLAASASHALRAPADQRAKFDEVTIEAVKQFFTAKIDEQLKAVAEFKDEESQLRAEVLGLWAISDVAKDHTIAVEIEKGEASAGVEQAAVNLKEKESDMKRLKTRAQHSAAMEVIYDDRIKQFAEAVKGVERIREGPPPAPIVEEAPVAEAMDVDSGVTDAPEATESKDATMEEAKAETPAEQVTEKVEATETPVAVEA